jgi:hypothetical protein
MRADDEIRTASISEPDPRQRSGSLMLAVRRLTAKPDRRRRSLEDEGRPVIQVSVHDVTDRRDDLQRAQLLVGEELQGG